MNKQRARQLEPEMKRLHVLSARDAERSLRSRPKDVVPLPVDDAVIPGQEDDGMRDNDEMITNLDKPHPRYLSYLL